MAPAAAELGRSAAEAALTITLAVKNLRHHTDYPRPVWVSGLLWLDATGARLFDWDTEEVAPLSDAQACEAIRATLPPPGEYLGGALMRVWVRAGPELFGAYRVVLGDLRNAPATEWGPDVSVRPEPSQYGIH